MVEYKMQNRKGAVKKLIIIHKLMQSALSPSLRGMSAKADKGSVLLFHCTPSVNCLKSAIASSLSEGAKAWTLHTWYSYARFLQSLFIV